MEWEFAERPGYFGKRRNDIYEHFDVKYGIRNWRIMFQWGENIIDRKEAWQIYEDAYYEFFKTNPEVLEKLVSTASDVYETDISNTKSGLDYRAQETKNNHIRDTAIRRAVLRSGKQFKGDHLVRVRGKNSEGGVLCPYLVPFHKPELILNEPVNDYHSLGKWWGAIGIPNSIESFYQQNKIIQHMPGGQVLGRRNSYLEQVR